MAWRSHVRTMLMILSALLGSGLFLSGIFYLDVYGVQTNEFKNAYDPKTGICREKVSNATKGAKVSGNVDEEDKFIDVKCLFRKEQIILASLPLPLGVLQFMAAFIFLFKTRVDYTIYAHLIWTLGSVIIAGDWAYITMKVQSRKKKQYDELVKLYHTYYSDYIDSSLPDLSNRRVIVLMVFACANVVFCIIFIFLALVLLSGDEWGEIPGSSPLSKICCCLIRRGNKRSSKKSKGSAAKATPYAGPRPSVASGTGEQPEYKGEVPGKIVSKPNKKKLSGPKKKGSKKSVASSGSGKRKKSKVAPVK